MKTKKQRKNVASCGEDRARTLQNSKNRITFKNWYLYLNINRLPKQVAKIICFSIAQICAQTFNHLVK